MQKLVRKSDWKYNLGGCRACKNLRAAPDKGRNLVSGRVHLGGPTCMPITFLLVDQSSATFCRMWEGLWVVTYFSDFRFVDPFRRYLRSKSKVVRNRAEYIALPNCWGALQKFVPTLSRLPPDTLPGKIS